MTEHELSPEYLTYLERRYNDIKQVLEAVLTNYHPSVLEENYLVETLESEFDYLADVLGFEDLAAFVMRLLKQKGIDVDDADDDED